MKYTKLILVIFLLSTIIACEKDFLDTELGGAISSEQAASSPAANEAIVNGIYASMRTYGVGGTTGHTDFGHRCLMGAYDMMGHDIVLNNFNWYIFYYNFQGRVETSSRTGIIWTTYYTFIADANIVINGLRSLETLTDEQNALLGQALAIKSFSLFNLVRVYSDTYAGNQTSPGVPIPDRLNFDGNARGTVQDVYDQIIPDLEEAVTLLEGFSRATKQQIDQSVAQGILARVYLETENWMGAANMANAARQSYGLMTGEEWVSDGFDQISNIEWMWGADIDSESQTGFASFFSHFDSNNGGYGGALGGFKLIDSRLYDMIPSTDLRKNAFVDPINGNATYPNVPAYGNLKFIDETFFEGDYSYMRSSEMYLIEAEAKARMNDATAAQVLYDLVKMRDPGYTLSTNTGDNLVNEVYLQRRIELWGEGFSYFDLKRLKLPLERTGGSHKGFGLQDEVAGGTLFKWQIPDDEINSNPMVNQEDQNN